MPAAASVPVTLVGEIFDTPRESDDSLVLRGAWADLAALDPSIQPDRWEVQPVAGTDVQDYRSSLQDAIGAGARVFVEGDSSSDASFLLFLSVVGLLGVVLVAMSIGGVFNTVLLETRQRTREVAVLKAVGLTPGPGRRDGHRDRRAGRPRRRPRRRPDRARWPSAGCSPTWARSPRRRASPTRSTTCSRWCCWSASGCSGSSIGAAGAYLPAQRAARASIAPVLQAE